MFLDRDGVLNKIVHRQGEVSSPWSLEEFVLIDGTAAAVAAAVAADFVPVVVTNQPDVARGNLDIAVLNEMHQLLKGQLAVEAILTCPHDRQDGCPCRKPRPGMLIDAAADLHLDLTQSWIVGDRWVDIAAGASVGTSTALVRNAHSWLPSAGVEPPHDLRPKIEGVSLVELITTILSRDRDRDA